MKLSYYYSSLISEIEEDIKSGYLSLDENIQILRSTENAFKEDIINNHRTNLERMLNITLPQEEIKNYYPVIDYYFADSKELKNYEYDSTFYPFEIEELNKAKAQYLSDKKKLEQITISELLKELKQISSIF